MITLLRRLRRDDSGGPMIEFALIAALFFFLIFAILDFGRLMYAVNFAERAAFVAARTAIVRPVACSGVTFPERHELESGVTGARFGNNCDVTTGTTGATTTTCDVVNVSCTGNASNATVSEIWNKVSFLMPNNATAADLTFSYDTDPALGYLGGPFTPMVTVDVSLQSFSFISPLGSLIGIASGTTSTLGTPNLPTYSVSLPAEDLNVGSGG